MVGLEALDLLDGFGEAHGQVQEHVALVGRGAEARQVFDVLERGLGPVEHDDKGQDQTAQGVKPPNVQEEASDGEEDRAHVEDDVGHGVGRERLHARVLDEATPDPAKALDDDCEGHDDERGDGQLDHLMVGAHEAVARLDGHLPEGGDHDNGEDQHADGLQPPPAHRVLVLVLAADEPRRRPDNHSRQEVQGGIHQTREDGHGGHRQDDGNLSSQQDRVGSEVDVNGEGDDAVSTVHIIVVLEPGNLGLGA